VAAVDMFLSKQKKPTFLGAINGMLCGLVAITPSAGFVNGTARFSWADLVNHCLVRVELPLQGPTLFQGR